MIIDGKKTAAELREELKKKIVELKSTYNAVPGLTVILVGEDAPSKIYVKNKEKFAKEIGINSEVIRYPSDLEEKELLNKITGELSSGQKNRVSLAKALINNPKVLLLDEPTASLDPEVGDYIRTFLENYKKERNISILLASHNMDEVKRLCKFVLMMKEGRIIDKGSPLELIEKHGQKNLEEVFLKLSRSKK